MRIALASDHAGFALKIQVSLWLLDAGHEVLDLGPSDDARIDYPDQAHKLADCLTQNNAERGVLVCGSGIGMAIAANRHRGIRAANCVTRFQAEYSRRHNDSNVLCLGERVVGAGLARAILNDFLTTAFEGKRHQVRVEKIER